MSCANIYLNIEMVQNYKRDFLTFLTAQIRCGFNIDWDTSTYSSGKISLVNAKELEKVTNLTRRTIKNYLCGFPSVYEYSGRFAVLPCSIMNKLLEETQDMAAAEKNGIIRTFCYFVCMCWLYRDFSRTKENIAADLDNKVADVRRRINWLVDNGYIAYKHKHTHYLGQQAKAAVYQLYDDEIPTAYWCKEWWNEQLAKRQISIEDILANYKNIF